ncbi:hypothetical protein BC826DRAFT_1104662 [Russula brevipes]|nr:hypothetical protein BC826DRAFT_1104662 [Russula brevipes]
MYCEILYPVAEPTSVPTVYRRYHYEHDPPSLEPTEFMVELRRGLRGAKRPGFWKNVKSAGWRFLLKLDNYMFSEPSLRPDFPVAAPSTPVPYGHKLAPDIHIMPAGCPSFLLSPPAPQEDGFLIVPSRSSRASRPRRQERLPPSPRPLPTPPGPPAAPPKISWANDPVILSSPTSKSTEPEVDPEELEAARFFAEVAPFLFLVDSGSSPEDAGEDDSDDLRSSSSSSSDSSSDAASVDNVPGPQYDTVTMNSTLTEETPDAAATSGADYLKEIGLSPEAFVALLDGADIPWVDSEDEADQD